MGRIAILNMRLGMTTMQVSLLLCKTADQHAIPGWFRAALQNSIGEDCRSDVQIRQYSKYLIGIVIPCFSLGNKPDR
ncbi:hypothetical protein EBU60_01275 [bacterium]|nr:hypothetical protein [bacterium]NDD11355.1 hypothetical protein [Betaproteobacteria bacterium]